MYTFPGKTTRCLRCFSHKKKRRQPHRSALPRGFVCLPGTPAPPSKGMDTDLFQTTTNCKGKAKRPPPAAEFLKIRGQKAPPRKTGTDNDSACRPRRRLRPTSFRPEAFAPPSPRPLPRKRPHGTGDPTHDRSAPQNEAHPASRKKDRFKTVRERTECCFENCL